MLPDKPSNKHKRSLVSGGSSAKEDHSDDGEDGYLREHRAKRTKVHHGVTRSSEPMGDPGANPVESSGPIPRVKSVRLKDVSRVQKKSPKRQSKPGSKKSQFRSKALESSIERALPQMPMAIQNLAARSKQLEERLRRGLEQTSSWGSEEWSSQELVYDVAEAA